MLTSILIPHYFWILTLLPKMTFRSHTRLTGLIPRRAGRVLAVEAGENRDDHAARRSRFGGEFALAGAVHQALVDHVVDRGSVPCVVRNVRKLGLNKGYMQTRG